MLITIAKVLTKDAGGGGAAGAAGGGVGGWPGDGRLPGAGGEAQYADRGGQRRCDQAVGEMVLEGLARSTRFMAAALPLRVFPPMFNSYAGGQTFGTHVDTAIRQDARTGQRIRTDLSATLFLTEPEEYDGGELVVEDSYGDAQGEAGGGGHGAVSGDESAPGGAGDARERGCRSFFWMQSMVRDGCAEDAAVRPGHGDPADWRGASSAQAAEVKESSGAVDGGVSQPAAAVGGDVGGRAPAGPCRGEWGSCYNLGWAEGPAWV